MKISISRESIYWLTIVALSLVIGFSQFAYAWTTAPASPPGGNVAGPLTVGSASQTKAGGNITLGGGGSLFAGGLVSAPQYCIGASCITAWPSGGGGGGGITGSGTTGKIPLWTGTGASIGDSRLTQWSNSVFGIPSISSPGSALMGQVVYASGALMSPTFCGGIASSCWWQVSPDSTSNMKIINIPSGFGGYIAAPMLYDTDNNSYSVDPNGQSTMNNIVANNIQSGTFAYTASDVSLKKDVKTIPDALGKILNLRGVEFNWKKDNTQSVGLIAQEVEGVFPQLVGTNPTTGVKGVQYEGLIGPLVEAVKEQQKEIEELKKEIEELKR